MAVDLKGLGESATSDERYDKAAIAEELLRIVGDTTFDVVGHDWGGSIAIAMAARAPGRVRSLVIEEEMAPGVAVELDEPGSARYPTWHGGFHRVPGLPEALIRGSEDRYIDFFLNLRADPRTLAPADRAFYLSQHRDEAKTRAMLGYYRAHVADAAFFRALEARKLRHPVLAIGGMFGMGTAVVRSARRIARDVSSAIFPQSAHYPAEEEPARFNECVLHFLGH